MLPSAVAMTEAIDLQEFEAPEPSKKPTKGYTAKVFQARCSNTMLRARKYYEGLGNSHNQHECLVRCRKHIEQSFESKLIVFQGHQE